MKVAVFGSAHSLPPGAYEESEYDHAKKKRAVAPIRLRGDPEEARAFYDSQRRRRPSSDLYISGVITFTEPVARVLPVEDELMDSFEDMVFAGQSPEQFLRLWYRHEDKGRPELHWSFNLEELTSGKLVTLYLRSEQRSRDGAIFRTWQEMEGRRHGFSSSLDPSVARPLKLSYKTTMARRPEKFARLKSLVEGIPLVELRSRDELCDRLEAMEVRVLKRGMKWLHVEFEGEGATVAGPCAREGFTSPDYLVQVMGRKEAAWKTRFSSLEKLESDYKPLFAYRSQWLKQVLNEHQPRFAIRIPRLDPEIPLGGILEIVNSEKEKHNERNGNEHPAGCRAPTGPIGEALSGLRERLAAVFATPMRVGGEAGAFGGAAPLAIGPASGGGISHGTAVERGGGAVRDVRRPGPIAQALGRIDGALLRRAKRRRRVGGSGWRDEGAGADPISIGGERDGASVGSESVSERVRTLRGTIVRGCKYQRIQLLELSVELDQYRGRVEEEIKRTVATPPEGDPAPSAVSPPGNGTPGMGGKLDFS